MTAASGPGIGGYSQDLNQQTPYSGTLQVAYNDYLQRYQMIVNAGVVLYYSESKNGLTWSPLSLLFDFRSVALAPVFTSLPSEWVTTPTFWSAVLHLLHQLSLERNRLARRHSEAIHRVVP